MEGSRLIAGSYGNKVKDWAIRRHISKPVTDKGMIVSQRLNGGAVERSRQSLGSRKLQSTPYTNISKETV